MTNYRKAGKGYFSFFSFFARFMEKVEHSEGVDEPMTVIKGSVSPSIRHDLLFFCPFEMTKTMYVFYF